MAVKHGNLKIPVMTKPYQYFEFGELFAYTPLSDKDIRMVLYPVLPDNDMSIIEACEECAIFGYCGKRPNRNPDGMNFIPDCNGSTRLDRKEVIFKKV